MRSSAEGHGGRDAGSGTRAQAGRYEGRCADGLERLFHLRKVVVFDQVGSTLDVAHALGAEGAPAGTLVLADAQTSGRGRLGRSWRSERGAGVWLTLIERPGSAAALDVLSLRVGLALAPVLDPYASPDIGPVGLKWPNDLYLRTGKVGGILIEARWREQTPEWVAIGVGINVRAPADEPRAAGLRDGVSRLELLSAAIPGIRAAAANPNAALTEAELAAYGKRDIAAGQRCVEPVAGRVRGIDPSGALVVDPIGGGAPVAVRAGSLVLEEDQ